MTDALAPHRTPLAARIIAVLFFVAALLMMIALPASWLQMDAAAQAGLIADEAVKSTRVLVTALGGALLLIYAGAGWTMWTARKWSLAMLLSVAGLFGYPVGTGLSVASIIVLCLPQVRTAFRARADGGG